MASSLCENCHKRPKFGVHKFCGKTCAAQAAAKPARSKQLPTQGRAGARNTGQQKGAPTTQRVLQLCNHCGQEPKFNGFDYCGKSCAALAGATQVKQPPMQGAPATKQKTMRAQANAPPNTVSTPSPAKPYKAPQPKVPVPQEDSTEEENEELEEEDSGGAATDLDAYPSDLGCESEDEPSVPQAAAPHPGTKSTSRGAKPSGSTPRIVPGICAIPGCGQPVHVNRQGVKTMYCSMKHREEGVRLGLEAACIMCKQYPQSSSDYFCSSACRNQSMTKT